MWGPGSRTPNKEPAREDADRHAPASNRSTHARSEPAPNGHTPTQPQVKPPGEHDEGSSIAGPDRPRTS
jgi:hypothetical protein